MPDKYEELKKSIRTFSFFRTQNVVRMIWAANYYDEALEIASVVLDEEKSNEKMIEAALGCCLNFKLYTFGGHRYIWICGLTRLVKGLWKRGQKGWIAIIHATILEEGIDLMFCIPRLVDDFARFSRGDDPKRFSLTVENIRKAYEKYWDRSLLSPRTFETDMLFLEQKVEKLK